ncbi:hypothetical protein ACPCHU_15895 [Bacillus bombysepticus]
MHLLYKNVSVAEKWLKEVLVSNSEDKALREFGLALADQILNSKYDLRIVLDDIRDVPTPISFVFMEREELLNLVRKMSICNLEKLNNRKDLAKVINALSFSYGNVGDVEVVAVLTRAVVRLNSDVDYISNITHYLLDQQHPEGCFGLLLEDIFEKEYLTNAVLRLTVEVLWALFEITYSYKNEDIKDRKSEVI